MAVSAGEISGIKTKLVDARTALVTMLGESDKQKQEACRTTVKNLTNETISLFSTLMEKAKGTNAEGKLKELKDAWDIFRNTRDNEVIPNFFAGKVAEAKAVGGGIQKERFAKISSMVEELLAIT
ncbi:MAG TPA: MCP four helix bundle domain-containing protein [Candidatus Wunengus sp. YC60]|uniref:MCP four helix bundle domain-containing protein n=1 Tax=Candidatus Wunengus sp. YC60 TaxID=3367697 RepID=UPI004027A09D